MKYVFLYFLQLGVQVHSWTYCLVIGRLGSPLFFATSACFLSFWKGPAVSYTCLSPHLTVWFSQSSWIFPTSNLFLLSVCLIRSDPLRIIFFWLICLQHPIMSAKSPHMYHLMSPNHDNEIHYIHGHALTQQEGFYRGWMLEAGI